MERYVFLLTLCWNLGKLSVKLSLNYTKLRPSFHRKVATLAVFAKYSESLAWKSTAFGPQNHEEWRF